MNEVLGIPIQSLTLGTLALTEIALIVMAFVRGWIVSKFAVDELTKSYNLVIEQANKRADDYWALYQLERTRGDLLEKVVDQLTVVGETTIRILDALPTPHNGVKSERVES